MKKLVILLLCAATISACSKKPKACFTFSKTENVKIGDTITLQNCSTNFTELEWTFPLNGVSKTTTPRVKMNTAGTYKVSLRVGKDNFLESSTEIKTIEVLP